MFEELSKALQTILRLKKENRFSEAEQTVNNALKEINDVNVEYLMRFTPAQLVIELSEKKKLEEEKIHAVAELLYQYGTLKEEQNPLENYKDHFASSLALFKFLQRVQTQNFNMQLLQRINELESRCNSE